MAGEFQRSLDFFLATAADASIARIYLAGGTARSAALQRAIEERSRLPVEVLDPFRRVAVDESRFDMSFLRAHAPEAVVGLGLALRQPGDH
jgi:type IV pilus assembly protein PilM